jgi:hypothetical protein
MTRKYEERSSLEDLEIDGCIVSKWILNKLSGRCGLDSFVRFEVFTAVTMKNAVFWDVAPRRSCVNRRFGGTYRLHLQGRKIRVRGTSVSRWQQTEPPVENTQIYQNRGREGEWVTLEVNRGEV